MNIKSALSPEKKRSLTTSIILWLFLLVVINQLATQYIAYKLSYHPDLGVPIYKNLYMPLGWLEWTIEYYTQYNYIFAPFVAILIVIYFILIFFVLYKRFKSRSAVGHSDIHGTARWAEEKDILNMGIMGQNKGVYIGAWQDKKKNIRYLQHNGPEHIMAFAPTRSGKGVGLVLPTLLSWPHSAVVLDIKGENWELTSGWRQQYAGNKVLKFDPGSADGSSIKFNPLEEIRVGTEYEVADVQNLAIMLMDTDGEGLDDFWKQSGFSFLVGLILHTIYKVRNEKSGEVANLSLLYSILNDPALEITEVIEEMLIYKHIIDPLTGISSTHKAVATSAREISNMSPAQLSGVVGSVSSKLGLFADPLISKNIERSEFKINDLMNDKSPVSLYLVIKPTDMDRLKPLTRIIINQILRILIKDLKFENGQALKTYKHRLLLMLDEFTSLGKLEVFQSSLAYMAGYGIKSYIIIQDLSQLYEAYSKEEAIVSNCHIRIAYAPNKIETAELLSKMAGTSTVVAKVTNASGSRMGLAMNKVTENYQEVSRPLLTPDECMTLPGPKKDSEGKVTEAGDMLIFVAGFPTVYGKQILFFKDPTFLARSKVNAPIQTDKIIAINNEDELKSTEYISKLNSMLKSKLASKPK